MRGVVGDTWWASVVFGVAHGCHEDTGRATPRPSNPLHTTPNPKNHTTGNHHTPHTHPPQMPSHTTTPTQNRTDLEPEPDRSRRGVRPISSRNRTDLDTEYDRSRRGTRPISTRVATDLDAGCDRSRAGTGPISTRVATDLDTGCDRSRRGLARGAGCGRAPASISSEASREPVRRRPRQSSGRAGRCPYAAQPCGRPRRSHR